MSEALPIASETAPGPSPEKHSFNLGLFGKTPPFTSRQWRIFLIVATAGFFDNYDAALLSLALKQIQAGLKIAEAHLGGVLSLIKIGYVAAIALTPFADVFGRRRLLLYTIIGYTIFTGLSAIAPDERAFVVCQMIARAFAGAEAVVALVILTEEVDAASRGWAVGLLQALTSAGYGLAALVFSLINVIPFGWRGLYALALIPLAVIIPLRRTLPESRRFERENLEGLRPSNVFQPLRALFAAYPRRLAIVTGVSFLIAMGDASPGLLFAKYLQEAHGWTPGSVSSLYFLGGGLGILGAIVSGRVSDKFGRRRAGVLSLIAAPVLTVWIYSARDWTVIPAWILQLFFDSASWTIVAAYSTELFPTSYRSTAASVRAVSAMIGGALGLFLEGILYTHVGSHWTAVRILTVFWMMAPIVLGLTFPETAGRELEAISPEESARTVS